jgi:hypothetical protein
MSGTSTPNIPLNPINPMDLLLQMQTQINFLQQQLIEYQNNNHNNSNINQEYIIKVNPPEIFTGKREMTLHFLSQCRLVFKSKPSISEAQKIVYACSFLHGHAFTWYSHLEVTNVTIQNFEEFTQLLINAFGETDSEEKAKIALKKLRQTKSCAMYSSEFNRLVAIIGYSDQKILIDIYKEGLNENVKDLLLTMPIRYTVNEYQKDAITCDERLFNHEQSKKFNSKFHYQDHTPQITPQITHQATPMEIDSIVTKPVNHNFIQKLTQEEKDRRREKNLCVYDGRADCPGRDDIRLCNTLARRSGNGMSLREGGQ